MNSRRSFLTKMGAVVPAAVASVTAVAGSGRRDADDPALQAALLEEEQALRKLHRAYEHAMDRELYEEVVAMFTHDAQVVFNGAVFENRDRGVSRLYLDRFRAGKTGRGMEQAPGFEVAAEQLRNSVEVAADRLTARAVLPFSIQVGVPLESESSLASMARLHGEGVRTWWEGGVYRVEYRRSAADGRWQISRLEYDTLSRADYRPGKSHARPLSESA